MLKGIIEELCGIDYDKINNRIRANSFKDI